MGRRGQEDDDGDVQPVRAPTRPTGSTPSLSPPATEPPAAATTTRPGAVASAGGQQSARNDIKPTRRSNNRQSLAQQDAAAKERAVRPSVAMATSMGNVVERDSEEEKEEERSATTQTSAQVAPGAVPVAGFNSIPTEQAIQSPKSSKGGVSPSRLSKGVVPPSTGDSWDPTVQDQGDNPAVALPNIPPLVTQDGPPVEPGTADGPTPLVAHLAPDEDEVAARITQDVTRRLQEEVAARAQEEMRRQAPAVQAVPMAEKNIEEDDERSGSRKWCYLGTALVVVIGIVIGVVLGTRSPPSPEPTPTTPPVAPSTVPPTPEPTTAPPTAAPRSERFEQIYGLIGKDIASDPSVLRDPDTNQFKALEWLADVDEAALEFMALPKQVLVERYVLALLYVATNGKAWDDSFGFMGAGSVCDWSSYNDDVEIVVGVTCDGPWVSDLTMCKWKPRSEYLFGSYERNLTPPFARHCFCL